MDRPELRVLADGDAVAAAAAEEIATTLADAVAARGRAHWATTGGSSAPPIYRRLRASPLRERVAWDLVDTWWGDDRFVPTDHPLSNVFALDQILLIQGGDESQSGATTSDNGESGVGVRMPLANLHPIPVAQAIAAGGGPELAAARYAEELRDRGPAPALTGLPAFDLVVLGVGPDGHILSVFPGSPAWDTTALCVAIPAPTHVEPHVPRVTVNPALVGAARRVLVVSTGSSKAGILARAWTGDDVRELPVRAARVPNAVWILDEGAAAELPRD